MVPALKNVITARAVSLNLYAKYYLAFLKAKLPVLKNPYPILVLHPPKVYLLSYCPPETACELP